MRILSLIPKLLVVLLFLGAVASSYYFYQRYQAAQRLLADPTAASQLEIDAITRELSKFMELPEDEEPTIATVLERDKLQDQPFFAKAENGDKVIIYTKSGKAILYRPSTKRIIELAPINIGEAEGVVKLAVYNGSGQSGLAKTFSETISAQASNVTVLTEATAAKRYSETLVIDLTGQKAELAEQMAQFIGGKVATLPEGESAPASSGGDSPDLLVILGSDFSERLSATEPATAVDDEAATETEADNVEAAPVE